MVSFFPVLCRFLLTAFCLLLAVIAASPATAQQTGGFRVMTWNIWHGGREDGEEIGPQRVARVVRDSQADLIALQETYGSGEKLAADLGFHFHARGTNVSILSRYPVIEDLSVCHEFQCVGGLVQRPDGQRVAFFSVWLPYDRDIWLPDSRRNLPVEELIGATRASAADLTGIRLAIQQRLAAEQYRDVPVILAGDFNSMSHLDYSSVHREQFGAIVDWPTSHVLVDEGWRDAYREVHPDVDRKRDRTWSPRFPDQEQDRIDFIYFLSPSLQVVQAGVLEEHPEGFPSDHAAVVADFRDREPPSGPLPCRVVTYNIKHGRGNDDRVELGRATEALRSLEADFIGLQEVDLGVERSGRINQPAELGRALQMHPAFGSFMDLQGGRYGLAILSRYPIRRVMEIPVPKGNEPRVALAVEAGLPDGSSLTVINLHFDWVSDDTFRFAQATRLAAYLRNLDGPWILMGDFNDQPDSRTVRLFRELALEAAKPPEDRFTFSSDQPRSEIDFIFMAPRKQWQVGECRVVDDPLTSDHRAVVAGLQLAAPDSAGSRTEAAGGNRVPGR